MKARTALVALAVAATLTSVAAAGSDAAKQRVVIDSRIYPERTFLFVPQQSGELERDSGTVSGNWKNDPGRTVMRDGQEVTAYQADWVFRGRRGTLTIHERNEWYARYEGFLDWRTR
jgi:hypothetical protein